MHRLFLIISSEYSRNKNTYKNTYKELENTLSKPSIIRLGINILNFCFYFFIFSLIILGTIYYIDSIPNAKHSSSLSYGFFYIALIMIIGFLVSISKFGYFIDDFFNNNKLKIRKNYKSYHMVPEDGYYICSCCNQKRYLYKYTYFARCPNKKNILKISYYKKVN